MHRNASPSLTLTFCCRSGAYASAEQDGLDKMLIWAAVAASPTPSIKAGPRRGAASATAPGGVLLAGCGEASLALQLWPIATTCVAFLPPGFPTTKAFQINTSPLMILVTFAASISPHCLRDHLIVNNLTRAFLLSAHTKEDSCFASL